MEIFLYLLLFVLISPLVLVQIKFVHKFKVVRRFLWADDLLKKDKICAYSEVEHVGIGTKLLYAPHPFTNWSLNPGYINEYGEVDHTKEGFRRVDGYLSLYDALDNANNKKLKKIVCIGGSTTYCTELSGYKESWPAKLQDKLDSDKYAVFNFGVGNWSTIQSVIRCTTWFPIINPDIVIIYQAKNDLSPFYNAYNIEKKISPDYQNIMGQFSQCYERYFPKFLAYIPLIRALYSFSISFKSIFCVYRGGATPSRDNLLSIDKNIFKEMMFRLQVLFDISSKSNARVIYIPEIVHGGVYADVLEKFYRQVEPFCYEKNNVEFTDISSLIPNNNHTFLDKMHLSEYGCGLFADIIKLKVIR